MWQGTRATKTLLCTHDHCVQHSLALLQPDGTLATILVQPRGVQAIHTPNNHCWGLQHTEPKNPQQSCCAEQESTTLTQKGKCSVVIKITCLEVPKCKFFAEYFKPAIWKLNCIMWGSISSWWLGMWVLTSGLLRKSEKWKIPPPAPPCSHSPSLLVAEMSHWLSADRWSKSKASYNDLQCRCWQISMRQHPADTLSGQHKSRTPGANCY